MDVLLFVIERSLLLTGNPDVSSVFVAALLFELTYFDVNDIFVSLLLVGDGTF